MKCHDVYWEISIGYAVFKAAVSRRFSKPVYHFQVWSGGIVVLLAGVFSADTGDDRFFSRCHDPDEYRFA